MKPKHLHPKPRASGGFTEFSEFARVYDQQAVYLGCACTRSLQEVIKNAFYPHKLKEKHLTNFYLVTAYHVSHPSRVKLFI